MSTAVAIDSARAAAAAANADVGEPTGLAALVEVGRYHGLHLTVSQLIHENVLPNREVSVAEIEKCAATAGLKAKVVTLDWAGLAHLGKALPAIVQLKNG